VTILDLLGASRDIGARFTLVGLMPTALLGLFVLSLLLSGAPGDAPSLDRIGDRAGELGAWETALIFLAVLGAALVLQPFQTPLVRALEGYWGTRGPGAALAARGVKRQLERLQDLDGLARTTLRGPDDPRAAAVVGAAAERERLFPDDATALLPTRLGNVMRSGESRAGAAYGMEAVVVWPRLYPLLGEAVRAVVDDRRDQLDLSARFCAVLVTAALVSLGLLVTHGWWLAVPAGCLVLAWLAYRGTVGAALAYGEGLRMAFDLHRFDLLRALHLPLPATRAEEIEQNSDLSAFLLQDWEVDLNYEHPS
jgi:hypothetical protein